MGIKDELKTKESDVVAPVNPKKVYSTDPVTGTLPAADTKVVAAAKPPADPKTIEANLSEADRALVDMGQVAAPVGRAITDADVIEGFNLDQSIDTGPALDAGHSEEKPAPGETSPPAPVSPPEVLPAATKSIKVAGREFKNADELAAYVEGLEANKVDLSKIFQPTVIDVPPADPDPAEIIFDDPKRAVELIKKSVREEWQAERRIEREEADRQKNTKQVWDTFYRDNPDLVGFEEVVREKLKEIPAKLSFAEGLPLLAQKSRVRVSEQRARLMPAEVVSVAVTTPPTRAMAPAPKAPEPVATSFIQELKGVRRKA